MNLVSPYHFHLDTPAQSELGLLSRFSGWYLVPKDQPVKLALFLDDQPRAALCYGSPRQDVAASYPTWPKAAASGFFGDILLPQDVLQRKQVGLSIWDLGHSKPLRLFTKNFRIASTLDNPVWRQRDFSLVSLLRCPTCKHNLEEEQESWVCSKCHTRGPLRGKALFFLDSADLPFQTLTETTNTHPYGEGAYRLLEKVGDGLVLDFGSGNSPQSALRARTCYLDIKQYAHTDVVTDRDSLPFKDNTFDGIVSQSVFEHLRDPFFTAAELFRILKPGGHIYVDTAFMQPLHGDPSHFFNMTRFGLQRVFHMFQAHRIDIAPHHLPSFGLMMQLDAVLPKMQESVWKDRLTSFRDILGRENQALDEALGEEGRNILAAGWFFEGKKPKDLTL